jgi:heme exporter protein A
VHPVPTPPLATIETRGLIRRFDRHEALSGVDLSVAPGDCLAIFGPNGAGKTTLLRVLAGLLDPSSGSASVAGVTLPGGLAARAQVGLISHHSMLYPALTARENVEFAARLHGLEAPRVSAESALDRLGVLDRANVPVRVLSRGLQQRVSIARAFVHVPRVVLLDEPYTGLDAAGAAALSLALEGLKSGGAALVLVTHHLDEGFAIATQVAVMRAGRFVLHLHRDAIDPVSFANEYRAAVGAAG